MSPTLRVARAAGMLLILFVAACGGSTASSSTPAAVPTSSVAPPATAAPTPSQPPKTTPTPTKAASPSVSVTASPPSSQSLVAAWSADLDALDRFVRSTHPNPFAIHSESEWVTRLASLKTSIADMSHDDAVVAITELVALLDSHSGVYAGENGFHIYGLLPYEFSDGEYVMAASDPSLVGMQLVGIGGTPIHDVRTRLTPLVNHDNDSQLHELRAWLTPIPEYLRAKGIIEDVTHRHFQLVGTGGAKETIDLEPLTPDDFGKQVPPIIGGLAGQTLEFVRHGLTDEVWWRVDAASHTFILGYVQTGADASAAIAALRDALDKGTVDRLVFDMRLAGGGDYTATAALQAAIGDPRLDHRNGRVVLISRENVSAANALAVALDRLPNTTLIGEPTAELPTTFGGDETFRFTVAPIVVHVPSYAIFPELANDAHDAVYPDIPVDLTAADFFAGKDRALEAALQR